MRQQEFESRVQMQVSIEEYSHIEQVYMNSDLDKDEFCKLWVKMNRSRVLASIEKEKARKQQEALNDKLWYIVTKYGSRDYKYIGSESAYSGFTKREKATIESAGLELESGICPKVMSTVLYEIRKYLKAA